MARQLRQFLVLSRIIIAIAKSFFRLFFDVGAQRAAPLHLGHGSPCPYGEITLGNPYKYYHQIVSRTSRDFKGKPHIYSS